MKKLPNHLKFFWSFLLTICLLLSCASQSYSQTENSWSKNEKRDYNTINRFCSYLSNKAFKEIDQDSVFNNYFYFDYASKDSNSDRKNKRILQFNELLQNFKRYIDSVGIGNLDTKPVRFFKSDTVFYEPFKNELKSYAENTFAYFIKSNPKKPLGYLLFDEKTSKLVSWILIDQGGTHYFLTFDMM